MIVRAIFYVIYMYVLPCVIIFWKFHSNEKSTSGAVIVVIGVIAIWGLVRTVGKIIQGINHPTVTKIYKGIFFLVAPILLVYFCTGYIARNIIMIRQILLLIALSMAIGVVVNPFPEWIEERTKDK